MSIWQAARFVAAGMLVMALFEMPDEYYKALRFVVAAAAIMEIIQIQRGLLTQGKKTAWTLTFAAIAIIFNPIMPLEMDREERAWFDVFGAVVFGAIGVDWGRFFSFLKDGPESRLVISSIVNIACGAAIIGLFILVILGMSKWGDSIPKKEDRWTRRVPDDFLKFKPSDSQ